MKIQKYIMSAAVAIATVGLPVAALADDLRKRLMRLTTGSAAPTAKIMANTTAMMGDVPLSWPRNSLKRISMMPAIIVATIV